MAFLVDVCCADFQSVCSAAGGRARRGAWHDRSRPAAFGQRHVPRYGLESRSKLRADQAIGLTRASASYCPMIVFCAGAFSSLLGLTSLSAVFVTNETGLNRLFRHQVTTHSQTSYTELLFTPHDRDTIVAPACRLATRLSKLTQPRLHENFLRNWVPVSTQKAFMRVHGC